MLPDGRIVAGGYTALPGHDADFAAVRIGPSGGLDPSFNPGPTPGRVTINFGGSGLDQALGLDVGPDGKAVLVGLTSGNGATDFAAARLNPDGTPDASFADGGKGVYHVGTTGSARAVRVRPDGRVVIAGTTNASGNADFAVLRLTPGGRLDTSFNGNGQNVVSFEFGSSEFSTLSALFSLNAACWLVGVAWLALGAIRRGGLEPALVRAD